MTKKKKLVKEALSHPEMYSDGELAYFQLWLKHRKINKQKQKQTRIEKLEALYNEHDG